MTPFTVIVEGNIGSGKTSLINFFRHKFPSRLFAVAEPIAKWRDCNGINLFSLLAQDPKKYAFPFQQYVQLTMTDVHFAEPDAGQDVKMIERSLFSARHCFVENLYRSGILTDAEYAVYQEWFKFLTKDLPKVDLILYLKASPEVCLERVAARNRKEEKQMSLDYLKNLDALHDEWLLYGSGNPPVLTIPANNNRQDMATIFEDITPFVVGDKKWVGNDKEEFVSQNIFFTKSTFNLKGNNREALSPKDENILVA